MAEILIIDDEKAIRKTLTEILSFEGLKNPNWFLFTKTPQQSMLAGMVSSLVCEKLETISITHTLHVTNHNRWTSNCLIPINVSSHILICPQNK